MKATVLAKGRLPIVALLASLVLVSSMLLTSSGGAPTSVAPEPTQGAPTPIATVAYLPPTVVPTPSNTPRPSPTAANAGPPAAPRQPPAPPPPGPAPAGGVPQVYGQLILVSLSQQWLWAYQDMQLWYDTPVTTGRPELPTPDGTFYLEQTLYGVTFYSPWPQSSPYYYSPEHVNYALQYTDNGYFIHDAPWRQVFGPGTNYPHTEPNGTPSNGSHGCVNVPTSAGAWLANWAQVGTTIVIYGTAPLPPPTPPATPTPTTQQAPTPTTGPTATPTTPPPTPTPMPPAPTPTATP